LEHRAIIGACRYGDADRAAAIIYDHVTHVGNSIIDYVRQQEREKESTV
jgi:DNA-binding GntR family transcriptional regulator